MTETNYFNDWKYEHAKDFASLIVTQKHVLSTVRGEARTFLANSQKNEFEKPAISEKKVAQVVFSSVQDGSVSQNNNVIPEPANLNGVELELYRQARERLITETNRIAMKKYENTLQAEEIMDIVRQIAIESVSPKNIFNTKKQVLIYTNLKKVGYRDDTASDALKDLLFSTAVSTSTFAASEMVKVGAVAWTINNIPSLNDINDPLTLAAIAASYASVAGIAAIMPNIQAYMIRNRGWSSDAISVGLTKFLAPVISTIDEKGNFVLDKNKHLNLVRGSTWLPQIAKGAYHGAIGGVLSPVATITANFTSSAFKCGEMVILNGLARKKEGLPFLPIDEAKNKVIKLYDKAKNKFRRK